MIEQGSYEEMPPPSSFASSTTLAEAEEPDQAGSVPRYRLHSAKAGEQLQGTDTTGLEHDLASDGCDKFNNGHPGIDRMVHESAHKFQKGKGRLQRRPCQPRKLATPRRSSRKNINAVVRRNNVLARSIVHQRPRRAHRPRRLRRRCERSRWIARLELPAASSIL